MLTLPRPVVDFFLRHRKLGALALRCVPDVKYRINIDPIGEFEIRLRRNRSFWIRSPLAAEAVMLGYLKSIIRPGDVVYDIGANLGLYTRFAGWFGAGEVYAFEPMSENIEILQRNVAAAGRDRPKTQVLALAAGDSDGEELLQVDDVMSATACLDRVRGGDASYGRQAYGLGPLTEKVRVARLDTLIESGTLPVPAVIKIDVEGAEGLVLEGATRLLEKHRPRLAIELHGAEIGQRVLSMLDGHGYHCFAHVQEDGQLRYRRVRHDEPGKLAAYDHIVAAADAGVVETPIAPFRLDSVASEAHGRA